MPPRPASTLKALLAGSFAALLVAVPLLAQSEPAPAAVEDVDLRPSLPIEVGLSRLERPVVETARS